MDTNDLFKYRSVTACMKASYELISDHFASYLKKTWWAVLIYAVFMALTIYFRMPNMHLHDWGNAYPVMSFIIQSLVYLAFFLTNYICGAAIWTWLNKKSFGNNFLHFLVVYLILDFFLALFTIGGTSLIQGFYVAFAAKAVAAKQSLTTAMGIAAGLGVVDLILMCIVILPFAHIIPNVLLLEKGEKFSPWKSYKQGLRHLGSIFKLGFLSTVVIAILTFIVMIPCMILSWAQISSQLGALGGDPLGVPGYFTLLFLVVLIASIFVFLYIGSWMVIAYAYLYGSHKTIELQKQERLQDEYQHKITI